MTQPTVLIVPGAMHIPAHWELVTSKLRTLSFPAECLALPETGANARTSREYDSVHAIRNRLENLVEKEEKEAILVCHSAGGNPGCQAVKGLERSARRRVGKPGGIVSLVFVAAFLIPEGSNLITTVEGQKLPSWGEPDASVPFFISISPNLTLKTNHRATFDDPYPSPESYSTTTSPRRNSGTGALFWSLKHFTARSRQFATPAGDLIFLRRMS